MIPKFRAWDKTTSKLHVVNGIYCDNKKIHYIDDKRVRFVGFDNVIIMQSTGLKDKNGKEIFELDILEIQGIRMVVKFGNYRYIEILKRKDHALGTVYDGLGFYIINAAGPDRIGPFEPETLKESVVIGNIYENAEMVREVK